MTPEPSGWPPAGEKIVLADQRATKLHVRTRRSDLTLDTSQKAVFIIGRDPNADISVDDTRVSWEHARLRVEGGIWIYEDPRSTNGSFLGTERVHRVEVNSLRVLMLGDVQEGQVLRLEPEAPPQPQAPRDHSRPSLCERSLPSRATSLVTSRLGTSRLGTSRLRPVSSPRPTRARAAQCRPAQCRAAGTSRPRPGVARRRPATRRPGTGPVAAQRAVPADRPVPGPAEGHQDRPPAD